MASFLRGSARNQLLKNATLTTRGPMNVTRIMAPQSTRSFNPSRSKPYQETEQEKIANVISVSKGHNHTLECRLKPLQAEEQEQIKYDAARIEGLEGAKDTLCGHNKLQGAVELMVEMSQLILWERRKREACYTDMLKEVREQSAFLESLGFDRK